MLCDSPLIKSSCPNFLSLYTEPNFCLTTGFPNPTGTTAAAQLQISYPMDAGLTIFEFESSGNTSNTLR